MFGVAGYGVCAHGASSFRTHFHAGGCAPPTIGGCAPPTMMKDVRCFHANGHGARGATPLMMNGVWFFHATRYSIELSQSRASEQFFCPNPRQPLYSPQVREREATSVQDV